MTNLHIQSAIELLELHVDIMKELRARDILRSNNLPTGDFGEYLFCEAFDWIRAPKSNKGFDAKDKKGKRYEIKSRRITRDNKSRQLSAIPNFDRFDILAAVLFDDYYQVKRAALIPSAVAHELSRYIKEDNHRVMLRDSVWNIRGVIDVTNELQTELRSMKNLVAKSTTQESTRKKKRSAGTTEIGFENRNGQIVIRATDMSGNDNEQKLYELECKPCGAHYYSNGSDIFQRKCPECQGGKPSSFPS